VQAVKEQGCKFSMDGRGAWKDNGFVERLWKSVKYERVYLYASFKEFINIKMKSIETLY
jgi:putative transposase